MLNEFSNINTCFFIVRITGHTDDGVILFDHISLGKTVLPATRELKNYLMMAVGYDSLRGVGYHGQPTCHGFLTVRLNRGRSYLTANPSISCETGLIGFRTIFMLYRGNFCVHL